jgi:hypothetical protein
MVWWGARAACAEVSIGLESQAWLWEPDIYGRIYLYTLHPMPVFSYNVIA